MRSELREKRLRIVTDRLAEYTRQKNHSIRRQLANKWDMRDGEVTTSHQFRKDMLMQYKTTLDIQNGETYDEVLVTLERNRSPLPGSLISFAFHITNTEISLMIHENAAIPKETKEKIQTIVLNCIQNELGFE